VPTTNDQLKDELHSANGKAHDIRLKLAVMECALNNILECGDIHGQNMIEHWQNELSGLHILTQELGAELPAIAETCDVASLAIAQATAPETPA